MELDANWARRVELEHQLFYLERELIQKNEERKQALYDQRERSAREAEYPGSFRALKDRFAGTFEENRARLHREYMEAVSRLEWIRREYADVQSRTARCRQELEAAEEAGQAFTREMAAFQGPKLQKRMLVLQADHRQALEEALLLSRPENMMDGQSWQQRKFEAIGRANALAGRVRSDLGELTLCQSLLEQSPLEVPSYYAAPDLFLVSASPYGDLDRINLALQQNRALTRSLENIRFPEPGFD